MHLMVLGAFCRGDAVAQLLGQASGLNTPYGAWCFLMIVIMSLILAPIGES